MSARRLIAFALVLIAAGPVAAEPLTVKIATTVIQSDPGLQILLPAADEFRTDANGEFTFPVYHFFGGDRPPAETPDLVDGQTVETTRLTQVRFDLSIPELGWATSLTVQGYTEYAYAFRAPPQEGAGWRTTSAYQTLDLLGNPLDPTTLTVDGVTFTREYSGEDTWSVAVTGLPQLDSPEPATLLLAGLGLGAVAIRRRIRHG